MITLREASRDDMDELARMMASPSVWQPLEYESAPTPFLLRMLHRRPDWHCLFIHRDDDKTPVGFFLLYGLVRPDMEVEFDIAVPNPDDRKNDLARQAIHAFERHMFDPPKCAGLWAWIDEKNRASLALVKLCRWPVTRKVEKGLEIADELVDVFEVRLQLKDWPAFAAKHRTRGGTARGGPG